MECTRQSVLKLFSRINYVHMQWLQLVSWDTHRFRRERHSHISNVNANDCPMWHDDKLSVLKCDCKRLSNVAWRCTVSLKCDCISNLPSSMNIKIQPDSETYNLNNNSSLPFIIHFIQQTFIIKTIILGYSTIRQLLLLTIYSRTLTM